MSLGSPTTQGVYKPVSDAILSNTARQLTTVTGLEVCAQAAQPTSGTVVQAVERSGSFFKIKWTFTLARVPVTDGAASGSYGTLKLCTFNPAAISFLGCRQDYTATEEGATLTTAAGDAVYVWGVGTAAAATARDGTLTSTEQDIGTKTGSITNSSGTGAGTAVDGAKTTALNGTATAVALYLNWSGSAATIDGSDYIDVTGTVTVSGVMLDDD